MGPFRILRKGIFSFILGHPLRFTRAWLVGLRITGHFPCFGDQRFTLGGEQFWFPSVTWFAEASLWTVKR